MRVNFRVNGDPVAVEVEPRLHLADCLREVLSLTGTHLGCEHGACGACTVIVDGAAVRACLILTVQAEDASVVTVEGLSSDEALSPLQIAFRKHHALQCGFCTPGMLTTAHALLTEEPDADADRIRSALSGNLCRCTGYIPIVEAVLEARAAYRKPTSHDRDEPVYRQPGRADRGPTLSARPRPVRWRFEARGHAACGHPRSPIAHGRVASVDASAALAIAGVRAVITAKDIGAVPRIPLRLLPLPGTERFLQPVIAADRVRYVGEPVAVVLGDSPALAEDGVGAIALDIEELPPVPDWHASGRGETLLFEEAGTNAAMVFTGVKGDAERAFRDADYVRRERFAVQRYTALPMEPRGLLAEWDAAQGRMTVLGAAKVPFFNRDTLAAMLGLSAAQVDLIENDVGGGFGARGEFYPEDFLIPFAARHVGRPVRWIEDRREHLTAMNHARQADCEVEIACRSDGTILGVRGEVFVDLGAYVRTNGLIQPRTLAQCLTGPYRVPNVRITSTALLTNKTPSGTYRAPGRYEASFFCERLIELAARDLGIDSAEMRRRNLIGPGEMPYRLPRLEPVGPAGDTECDSGDYRETLERCLAEFGWEEKRALQGREIDRRFHGVAVACFIEGGGAGPKETARLDLEADGTVSVYVGSAAVGQGLETVMAQIAADTLGLPLGQCRTTL